MKRPCRLVLAAPAASLLLASEARAGMPSATLDDLVSMRVEAISFFGICFLLCAWIVQLVWNGLRRDFPKLPRLSYRRSVGVVFLWGMMFLLVLTMISGARELMTPGAWRKEGYTFKLDDGAKPEAASPVDQARERGMESLRLALWSYAATHGGRFPENDKVVEVPEVVWRIPDPSGLRYLYSGGSKTVNQGRVPIAYEPGVFGPSRITLLSNGEIVKMSPEEIKAAIEGGSK